MSKQPQLISGFRAVVVSSLVSVGDIAFSFIVAAITGSTVMFAQGLQGFADLVTTVFLLLGVKRSRRAPTTSHPFGYGRELFFWVLMASLFAFLVTGGLAALRAIREIMNGTELDNVYIALLALTFGIITNGYSLSVSARRLRQGVTDKSFWSYIRHSSLVETKMTALVDFMGTLSAVFGLIALSLFAVTGNTLFDGIGALLIAFMTMGGALIVIIDLHDLIVGRSPHPEVIETIRKTALRVKGVMDVLDLRAITVGSERILVILEVHFADELTADDIEEVTDTIKERVQAKEPQVVRIQIEAETPDHQLEEKKKRKTRRSIKPRARRFKK